MGEVGRPLDLGHQRTGTRGNRGRDEEGDAGCDTPIQVLQQRGESLLRPVTGELHIDPLGIGGPAQRQRRASREPGPGRKAFGVEHRDLGAAQRALQLPQQVQV